MTKDPYRYFRVEARDILEQVGQGALDLEKGTPEPDLVSRLLRLAHSLKGAARVVRQGEIAERAHAIEESLASVREGTGPVPRERIDQVLTLLDEIDVRVRRLSAPEGPESAEAARVSPEVRPDVVRPDLDELEDLLAGIADAHAQVASLRPRMEGIERARHLSDLVLNQVSMPRLREGGEPAGGTDRTRSMAAELRDIVAGLGRDLAETLDRIDRELRHVRDAADRLQLAPATALFTFLERAVRETARALDKQVVFDGRGGDTRIDGAVLSVVQGALLQVVRNAVAHGIEPDSQRIAAGKPSAGRVVVDVQRRGKWVTFSCTDDGRGIDLEAVKRALLRKGVLSSATERLERDALLALLLRGQISTSSTVTDVSGRGIGLDVVREAAERLGGQVALRTEPGRGTTVELVVPSSLASFDALGVEDGAAVSLLPLEAVRSTLRVAPADVVHTPDGDTMFFDGSHIPFAELRRILSPGRPAVTLPGTCAAVVVHTRTGHVALGVDRIVGTSSVVVRALSDLAPVDPVVAGASLDAEGVPRLVLDPESLAERARQLRSPESPPQLRRSAILVIDDSLTTRMLEQSILESAGYDVDLALSGEEALEKARRKRYALFLVDVEMPGMDGFSFIEQVRTDPALRDVPSILVTSRTSVEDRRRGRDVGAQEYIVKTEFNQGVLLERIRSLVR